MVRAHIHFWIGYSILMLRGSGYRGAFLLRGPEYASKQWRSTKFQGLGRPVPISWKLTPMLCVQGQSRISGRPGFHAPFSGKTPPPHKAPGQRRGPGGRSACCRPLRHVGLSRCVRPDGRARAYLQFSRGFASCLRAIQTKWPRTGSPWPKNPNGHRSPRWEDSRLGPWNEGRPSPFERPLF